ncbi:hypothetical protein PO002_44200 [Cupriavidus necator]|uniref:hypothetical protein n=1 Tax=Cupriavidus necator TaxID=106590 RepID=UPI0039C27F7E
MLIYMRGSRAPDVIRRSKQHGQITNLANSPHFSLIFFLDITMNSDQSDGTGSFEEIPLGRATTPSVSASGGSLPVVVKLLLQQPEGDDLRNIALLGYN